MCNFFVLRTLKPCIGWWNIVLLHVKDYDSSERYVPTLYWACMCDYIFSLSRLAFNNSLWYFFQKRNKLERYPHKGWNYYFTNYTLCLHINKRGMALGFIKQNIGRDIRLEEGWIVVYKICSIKATLINAWASLRLVYWSWCSGNMQQQKSNDRSMI